MRKRTQTEAIAYLGLGSNLGDRLASITSAVSALDEHAKIKVDFNAGVAPLYETTPAGVPSPQPDYLNSVVRVSTTLSPRALLEAVLQIEADLGRVRSRPLEARVIDIDLLLYDDRTIDEPDLSIPHPRLHERLFVLAPLCDIAPDVVHPVSRRPLDKLLDEARSVTQAEAIRLYHSSDAAWCLGGSQASEGTKQAV